MTDVTIVLLTVALMVCDWMVGATDTVGEYCGQGMWEYDNGCECGGEKDACMRVCTMSFDGNGDCENMGMVA